MWRCNLVYPFHNGNYVNKYTNQIYKHIDQDRPSTKSTGGIAYISRYSELFDVDVVVDRA